MNKTVRNTNTGYYKNSSGIKNKPSVTIIVPAYNEADLVEKNLTILCEYMNSLEDKYTWELIIVNDGSTDNTGDICDNFAKVHKQIKVIHHMYNFRLGQALRFAFRKCKSDYVVTMDLDLSYSPDHIGRILAKIKETRAKIVIASPYMKGGKVSNVPWLRKIMSKYANKFLSVVVMHDVFSDKITTFSGMVRGYDGKFLSKLNLRSMDMGIHPEIIYKAMILRARIVEIPAHLKWHDRARVSSMRIQRGVISNLLSGFIFHPSIFYIIPGLILMLIAMYPISWAFIHTFVNYGLSPAAHKPFELTFSASVAAAYSLSPHSFVIGGIAMIIAIQLLSFGILALQSKRYYEDLFHLGSTFFNDKREKENINR